MGIPRDYLLMGLFALANGASLAHLVVANRMRGELQVRAPEYAKAIYREGGFGGLGWQWPVRIGPLFSLEPPAAMRASVLAIKALLALCLLSGLGLFAALMLR